MATTNYNIRLDKDLKDKAFSVFEGYGLSPSQAIKLFLNQVADTNSIPLSFDYKACDNQHIPNAATIKAIEELNNNTGSAYKNFDEFLHELDDEDELGQSDILGRQSVKQSVTNEKG